MPETRRFWVTEPWKPPYDDDRERHCLHANPDCGQFRYPDSYIGRLHVPVEAIQRDGDEMWFCRKCTDVEAMRDA